MAKKESAKTSHASGRVAGFLLMVLGLFMASGLITYFNPIRHEFSGILSSWYPNAAGGFGRWTAGFLLGESGWIGAFLVAGLVSAWGWNRLWVRAPRTLALHSLATVPLSLSWVTMLAALEAPVQWTGNVGVGLWTPVKAAVGPVGGVLTFAGLTLVFLMVEAQLLTGDAWRRLLRRSGRFVGGILILVLSHSMHALVRAASWVWQLARDAVRSFWSHDDVATTGWERPRESDKAEPRIVANDDKADAIRQSRAEAETPERTPESILRQVPEGVAGKDDVGGFVKPRKAPRRSAKVLINSVRGKFTLPGTDLLDEVPDTGPSVPETELLTNSQILMDTLQDFGITGKVGEVHPGPVITRYEFTPGPGVRVSQILNRADDLALKLRAIRIRIVAPIPGKAAVGIEVPNHSPKMIYLRRLLEAKQFREVGGPLSLALGRDINGSPVIAELSRMPHLLVAGTTGSGKSVCINSIVTSLVMKNTPDELRMLMIDPKMLELPVYNGIPHLLTEVVTDPRMAARALKWLIAEMERRYNLLATKGSRNIQSYNAKVEKAGSQADVSPLPFIVAVIDELADLMIVSGREVEEPVARLAQMARAVGIHLIVATQRPSVDVLTGVIKANFPTRIAFQVASKTDSRTILDQNGAETLLGRGDMLFLPPGQAAPERVHGAFVSETETQSLVRFLKDQELTQEDMGLEEALNEVPGAGGVQTLQDPRYEEAARVVVAAGQGSASLLQRRMQVGYARAGRLVDMLEATGVVSPSDGSKPREILIDDVRLEQMLRERDEL